MVPIFGQLMKTKVTTVSYDKDGTNYLWKDKQYLGIGKQFSHAGLRKEGEIHEFYDLPFYGTRSFPRRDDLQRRQRRDDLPRYNLRKTYHYKGK